MNLKFNCVSIGDLKDVFYCSLFQKELLVEILPKLFTKLHIQTPGQMSNDVYLFVVHL